MRTETAKHTPGPWTLDRESVEGHDAPRLRVRGTAGLTRPLIVELDERDEDNARLIAAAPDLLAVLQRIISRATAPMSNGDIDYDDVSAARAAIAKATGQEVRP